MSTTGVTREILSDQIDWWHTDKHGFTKYQPSSNNVPLTETELDSSVWGSVQWIVEQLSLEAWHNNARQTFPRVAVNDCAISQRDIGKIYKSLTFFASGGVWLACGSWMLINAVEPSVFILEIGTDVQISISNEKKETEREKIVITFSARLFLSSKRQREIISHVSNWRKRKDDQLVHDDKWTNWIGSHDAINSLCRYDRNQLTIATETVLTCMRPVVVFWRFISHNNMKWSHHARLRETFSPTPT